MTKQSKFLACCAVFFLSYILSFIFSEHASIPAKLGGATANSIVAMVTGLVPAAIFSVFRAKKGENASLHLFLPWGVSTVICAFLFFGPHNWTSALVNNSETDFQSIQAKALQGDPVAQSKLGGLYFSGTGIEQNKVEAAKWKRKAAEQGYAQAQYNLGSMYNFGWGVPQDYTKAAKWFQKAADQGNAPAQANLGAAYFYGHGVPQDDKIAAYFFRISADKGEAVAQAGLGSLYLEGRGGLQQNYGEAVKWYRKAADQGHTFAQGNLGLLYATGQGIPQNYEEAYFWATLASAANPKVADFRDGVSAQLSPQQISAIQRRAAAWKPTPALQ
jgi:TPR repeat protein